MQAATIQSAGWLLLAGSGAADEAALPPAFLSGFATLATPIGSGWLLVLSWPLFR
jgi:hypothetical protein